VWSDKHLYRHLRFIGMNDRTVLKVWIVGLCIVTQQSIETPHTYRI
jgi:hypothetical protein